MKSHHCLICIGSNFTPQENMELARRELFKKFPDIVFGKEIFTDPMFFVRNPSQFHNQLAAFHSELSIEKINQFFKEIERKSGRVCGDKVKEIVKLDIDLLVMDNLTIRTKEMQRGYIKEGKKELGF